MVGQGQLDFACLMGYLHRVIAQIEDPRQPSNNTQYTIKDAHRSAFSVFFIHRTYALYKLLIMCINGNRTLQAFLNHHLISSDR